MVLDITIRIPYDSRVISVRHEHDRDFANNLPTFCFSAYCKVSHLRLKRHGNELT